MALFDDDPSTPLSFHATSPNEVKTRVEGLEPGMYVTRLDRPWIETTFPPEGFLIESKEQIEQIRQTSRFAYVDTQRGESPAPQYWVLDETQLTLETPAESPLFVPSEQPNEFTRLKKSVYEISTDFQLELETAKDIKKRLAQDIQGTLSDLQKDKPLKIERLKEGISAIVDSIIRNPSAFTLLTQLKHKDAYSYSHALSTSVWCAQFGRHLGLDKDDLQRLALGGMLLDIGKIKIPPRILNKTNGFTEKELQIIRSHVQHSVRLADATNEVDSQVLQMIATHHERANGTGYPNALRNDEIPIFGRIAGIVDSYDAMTSVRPYNPHALTPHEAINELYNSQDLFQPELVEQFIQTVGIYPVGSLVELKSGEVGAVIAVHDLKRLSPTVMILLDKHKKPLKNFIIVDLAENPDEDRIIVRGLLNGAYGIDMNELFL